MYSERNSLAKNNGAILFLLQIVAQVVGWAKVGF